MWNKSHQKPLGETTLTVINPRNGEKNDVAFTVVNNELSCLLGLQTIQEMGLITVNDDTFISQVSGIEPLGDLGEAKLDVDPNVSPRALPCRKVPIALQDEVKRDLDNLVKRGVVIPINEPTKWISQMATVRKANGKLRLCIDPQPLNVALMREHYKLSTFDDVLPKLHNAKVFSKIDTKEAYWHVKLDEQSSKLTTMITPSGRYRWARLPFGLKVSSEHFQKRLHHAIADLNGVVCVADDIIIVGCGTTQELADRDHAKNLEILMERCRKCNIRVNEENMALKQTEVEFLGHKITRDGIEASQKKVQAIVEMSAPTDVTGVRRLCGMVQYLARYTPNLADDLEPIHALTRSNTEFVWSQVCQDAFSRLKRKLSETPVLAYYNPDETLVLQVDSSKDGLRAALMQNGKPIEHASRNLRSNERN